MFSPLADLDRHAAERPEAVALASPNARFTFSELKSAVDGAAIRLRRAGVNPRDVVAVDLPQAQEWIVDLALLRLATRSVSLAGVTGLNGLRVDALVTAPGRRALAAKIELMVDDQWIAAASDEAQGPVPSVAYPRSDSLFRLMLTSGTTGVPRAAAYSVAAFEHRRGGLHRYWSDGRPELNFMALSTTGGFHTATANLRHGQTHRAVDHIVAETLRFAQSEQVRVLCGSPVQVAAAMKVLTEHTITLDSLEEVRLAGASASATLLRRITEVLGVPVRGVYGSTEGGGVTARMLHPEDDPANVGAALPGIELQVVDDAGSALPPGAEGTVRYRSKGQVSGYLDGAEVTPFPRGWFEPGDIGALLPNGSLILGGRASEVLNLGGRKIDPAAVDQAAAEFPGVVDAAAFGFERSNGIAELGLAVVAGPECDLRELDRHLRRQLPLGHPTAFWRTTEIPRNRMGKAERAQLRARFEPGSSER